MPQSPVGWAFMPTRFQTTLDYGTRGQRVPTLPRRTHTLRPTQSAILPVNQRQPENHPFPFSGCLNLRRVGIYAHAVSNHLGLRNAWAASAHPTRFQAAPQHKIHRQPKHEKTAANATSHLQRFQSNPVKLSKRVRRARCLPHPCARFPEWNRQAGFPKSCPACRLHP